ncbi:hypothetical protein DYBT9275_01285 [Dyadobacter sp. CECT 9275]|uniref:Lipocalin-like domain-containing protein n=1 Tax=Dyadobacter helix TaxID=2822344 RepID=A0A916N389_9BACT|nr:lipocalin family protein [Dyadobacter sp. CECT 9275]CAG4994001.1 hypothetical protein DYBT9275_01285 [Dyadobacter sp. CECT 9275]
MKRLLLTLSVFAIGYLTVPAAHAQNITGTWKMSSAVLEESNGKKSDTHQDQLKNMPCASTITYTFKPDGTLVTNAPDCKNLKAIIESQNGKTTWKQNGNKVTITTTDTRFPAQVYSVSVTGNTMTWYFGYADNPKTANPTKAKSLVTVYKKI